MAKTEEAKLYKVDKTLYPKDRYRKHRRLVDDNKNEITEFYERLKITEKATDSIYTVQMGEENALDLVALKLYNDESLWWIIAEASNIADPYNVPAGTVLRIPSITSICGYKGILA